MDIRGLEIQTIMNCIDGIVDKAKSEILKMPSETWTIENRRVGDAIYINKVHYILSLKLSPPLKEDVVKKMMVCCEVGIPSKATSLEIPLMYNSTSGIIRTIGNKEVKEEMLDLFVKLIKEY